MMYFSQLPYISAHLLRYSRGHIPLLTTPYYIHLKSEFLTFPAECNVG